MPRQIDRADIYSFAHIPQVSTGVEFFISRSAMNP